MTHRTRARHRRERPDREARHTAKRQMLLEAAISVVRREGPGASMESIAREAGITKPIIYRAFGDREGLTKAVADRFAEELYLELETAITKEVPDRERVRGAIDAYLAFVERDPQIARFLIQRRVWDVEETAVASTAFVRGIGERVAQALGEALRARGLDSGAAEPWAFGIVGMVHLAGDMWIERRTMPREDLTEYLTSLVWDGMSRFDRAPTGDQPVLEATT
jgi:AcrR family transcriptional regulator